MKKTVCIASILVLVLFSSCGGDTGPAAEALPTPPAEAAATPAPEATPTPAPEAPAAETRARPAIDREGYAITLPDEINTIVTIGPSNTEVLSALGFAGQIVSTDRHSYNVPGIAEDIAVLDMMALDAEFLIELNPDIIFITGMTRVHGDGDPLSQVSDAGITVVFMPSSISIGAIMEDIRFMAAVLDAYEEGEEIISEMQAEIDIITEIVSTIQATRTVYFEISPAPHLWTVGANTFINEMIELAGGVNVFGDRDSWVGVADEIVLEINPEVIITSISFLDDPVDEIINRPGWDAITAVQNGDVFQVSTDYTNRPSQNVVRGLRQIAAAIHPDYFN